MNEIFCVSKVPAPVPPEWYKFYFVKALNDPTIRKDLLRKTDGRSPAYTKRNYIGRYLIKSAFEATASGIKGYPADRLVIRYPKLFPSWLKYVKDCKVIWDNPMLDNDQPFITVLLLSKFTGIHNTNDSVDRFLADIVESVRKVYPDELIVLKTKPAIRN